MGRKMNIQLGRSAVACVVVLIASTTVAQGEQTLKARCSQLMTFYDWYGSGRSENSDGSRHHTRIAADIDCKKGNYQDGIAAMEALLRRKKFDVPPPPTAMAQVPAAAEVLMR